MPSIDQVVEAIVQARANAGLPTPTARTTPRAPEKIQDLREDANRDLGHALTHQGGSVALANHRDLCA